MENKTDVLTTWLNNRFKLCDEHGVYIAHQPIYGFRQAPSELGHISRYIITYRLLDSLCDLEFGSLLDVGAAEGYKAFLAQKIFGIPVMSSDLSEEACNRAREIFRIQSQPCDIHNLNFDDNQFDVVMCSESLEHVTDWKKATSELLRVARKAVVITVPQDSKKLIEHNKATKKIHSHIHHFDSDSFNYLVSEGYTVKVYKISSSLLVIPSCLVDAQIRDHDEAWSHPRIVTHIYNKLALMMKCITGPKTAAFLIGLDRCLCSLFQLHQTNLFVILKNRNYLLHRRVIKKIPIRDIVTFSVPHHYL